MAHTRKQPVPRRARKGANVSKPADHDQHREGATEKQVGDRTGPGAGYDKEPEQEKDKGGVTPS